MNRYNWISKTFGGLISGVIFPTKVECAQTKLPEGPVLLCANHISGADVLLLISRTKRQVRFMAKKELFSIPFIGWLIRTMGAFPVDRAAMDVSAVKKGIKLLESGEMVGIFPQGTRCDGVHPATTEGLIHGGLGLIALRAKATILPVAIETKNYKVRPFRRVRIIYGAPVPYGEYAALGEGRDGNLAVSRMIFERICQMLPPPPPLPDGEQGNQGAVR